jgi:hypothetical protein
LLDDIPVLGALFSTARISKLKQIERNISDWPELPDGCTSRYIAPSLGWGMKQRLSKGYLE